jgi:uncharacterized protein (DUF58 family)
VVVAAGAILARQDILYNLWYLLTALLVVSFLWAWAGVRWVRVERQTRTTRSQVGKALEERLVVTNLGFLPKLWLEVRDHSTLPEHQVSRVISPLGGHKAYSKLLRTRCLQRGRFTLGPITLTSGDPFGLFRMSRRLDSPAPATFLVYPATVDVPSFAPLIGFLPGGDTMRRRTSFVTTNVSGVREYAPGDSFNRIHWPSTARMGRLISKEFELDPTADIWLFLDLERDVQLEAPAPSLDSPMVPMPWEPRRPFALAPSTVEYGITIVASLAKHFVAQDRAVGFIAYAPHREIIPADRGERQLSKILETLAVIRAEGEIPLAEIVASEGTLLRRNTTAIIVTPTDRDFAVAARDVIERGVRVVCVLIERQSFGHPRSNQDMVNQLAISGMATYLVKEGDDLAEALATPHAQAILPVGRW